MYRIVCFSEGTTSVLGFGMTMGQANEALLYLFNRDNQTSYLNWGRARLSHPEAQVKSDGTRSYRKNNKLYKVTQEL